MKLRLVFSALVASVLCSAVIEAAPIVVYGNLGSSGTGALGSTNTDVGPAQNDFIAQGFTASAPNLAVQSVSLGLFGVSEGSIPATIGIFQDDGGKPLMPLSAPLYTSATVLVGAKSTYSFAFSNATLLNGGTYWVVPLTDVSWYLNSPSSAPTGQNSSGYSYVSTLENIDGGGWTSAGSSRYSISIVASDATAVPEIDPAGFGSVAALIAGMAGLLERRRQQVVARANG